MFIIYVFFISDQKDDGPKTSTSTFNPFFDTIKNHQTDIFDDKIKPHLEEDVKFREISNVFESSKAISPLNEDPYLTKSRIKVSANLMSPSASRMPSSRVFSSLLNDDRNISVGINPETTIADIPTSNNDLMDIPNFNHFNMENEKMDSNKLNDINYNVQKPNLNALNDFFNRVNCIRNLNGFNSIASKLPNRPTDEDFPNNRPNFQNEIEKTMRLNSMPSAKENLNTSLLTLSPPQTLSPQNQSQNMSLSSLSASPQNEDDEDEAESNFSNNNVLINMKKLEDIYPSPVTITKSFLSSVSSPPLTPRNVMSSRRPYDYAKLSMLARHSEMRTPKNSNIKEPLNLNDALMTPYEAKFRSYPSRMWDNSHNIMNTPNNFSPLSSHPKFNIDNRPSKSEQNLSKFDPYVDFSSLASEKILSQLCPFPGELEMLPSSVTSLLSDYKSPSDSNLQTNKVEIKAENFAEEYPKNELKNTNGIITEQVGVFAKSIIRKSTRYGPFIGKSVTIPKNRSYAWKVSHTACTNILLFIESFF